MVAALSPPSPDQSTEPGQWRASQMYNALVFRTKEQEALETASLLLLLLFSHDM